MIKLKIKTVYSLNPATRGFIPSGRVLYVARQFTWNSLEDVKNKNQLDYQQIEVELASIAMDVNSNRLLIPIRDPRLYINSEEELNHIFYILSNSISQLHLTVDTKDFTKDEAKKEVEFILSLGGIRREFSIIKYI